MRWLHILFVFSSYSYSCHVQLKWSTLDRSYGQKVLDTFGITSVAAPCETELQKVFAITKWVHQLGSHSVDAISARPDALAIVADGLENKKFRCVEYSIVLHACLNAIGIPARIIKLKTADCESREFAAGHVVVEAFVNPLGKWIMIDPQENTVPIVQGVPLHTWELKNALNSNSKLQFVSSIGIIDGENSKRYKAFIEPYLFYIQTDIENSYTPRLGQESLMLVPEGAPCPKFFQKKYPLLNVTYISSVESFYQIPNIKNGEKSI